MADITHADLLALQRVVISSVRHEVGQARTEFREKFDELKGLHEEQDRRGDRHERELARLDERTKLSARGLFSGLTRKQKAALWTIAGGASSIAVDGIRHVGVMLYALFAAGVRH